MGVKKGSQKGSQKKSKKGSLYQYGLPKLTETEEQVLKMWTEYFWTVEKISSARQTSKRAVYKTLEKLREKGLLTQKNQLRTKSLCGSEKSSQNLEKNYIRFHSLELNVKIIKTSKFYEDLKKKSNVFSFKGDTVRLYKKSLEVYINQSFSANNVNDARTLGFNYYQLLLKKLEDKLQITLFRDGYNNVRIVKQHFSEVNNELASDMNKKKDKMSLKGVDGKEWLLVDNSHNLNELETVHSEFAERDMREIIKPFFDDLRKYPTLLSDIVLVLKELSEQTSIIGKEQEITVKTLKSIVDIMNLNNKKPKKSKVIKPDYIS